MLPHTDVLLASGPVDPLLFTDADAVIDCIYPAESTGSAVADVLFGAANPASRSIHVVYYPFPSRKSHTWGNIPGNIWVVLRAGINVHVDGCPNSCGIDSG